jgi:3-carboxy-cis,cis-muconate cycloisomerase
MAVSPFDHPLYRDLLGDDEVAGHFAGEREWAQYVRFETALARAAAAEGLIPEAAAEAIATAVFHPDETAIRAATARDGVPIPEFVRQLRQHVGERYAAHVHFGATSQDVIDTGLVLRLGTVADILDRRLADLVAAFEHLASRFGDHRLMGRTRMQDALPITVGSRVETWSLPLARHRVRLQELRPRLLVLQFGGAVGTLEKFGARGGAVAKRLAINLGLGLPQRSWHTQRDGLVEFAGWLSLLTGSLGKFGADVALMAQNAIAEIELEGGGGSSTMPHKSNPVRAEALVALALYNATLLPAMHHALVAEQERSGAAWTAEWLTLPQMAVATGAALRTAMALAGSIRGMGTRNG